MNPCNSTFLFALWHVLTLKCTKYKHKMWSDRVACF